VPERRRYGIAYDALDARQELGTQFEAMVRTVRQAEALGFDSIWLGETHRRRPGYGHLPAPLLVGVALAATTRRIAIGTGVLLLPAYTPLQVAEQAAVLDQLSSGRLILGVASGLEVYRDFGFRNFGFGPTDVRPMLDEGLEILCRLWSGDEVTYHGRYWHYEGAACVPLPAQRPRPPILVGGITERALQRALQVEGWIGGTPYPLPLIVNVAHRLRELGMPSHGNTLALIRPIVVAASSARARECAERWVGPLVDYYLQRGAYVRPDFTFVRDPDHLVREEAMREVPIVGDPGQCAEQIERYATEAGINHFIFRVRFPGSPPEAVEQSLQLIAEEVLPRVRERIAP
jgi:alkanesulfonate monooxygenase SsuD/methylene tetrahydromethanopterin reductase-like flavin-dependent oxidoreductase (luciferase family)